MSQPENLTPDDLATIDRALLQLRRFATGAAPQVADGERAVDFSTLLVVEALVAAGVPLSVQELATELDVAHSTASRFADRAATAGAVTRAAHQDDARRRAVGLTPEGRALAERARTYRQAYLAAALAEWSSDDASRFAQALGRFADETRSRSPFRAP